VLKKRIIDQSKVEVVDIINLVTSVLGKQTPNSAIYSQMVNGSINLQHSHPNG